MYKIIFQTTGTRFMMGFLSLTLGLILFSLNIAQISFALNENNSTLMVSGTASTSVSTDQVTISFGVITTNDTAQKALDENSKIMTNVIASLFNTGIKQNQTSTDTFSISPEYNYSDNGRGKIIGYTATNSIQVKSKDIGNVSKWIDAASLAGANNVNSISFSISDDKYSKTKTSLIKKAIDDAKYKAETAALAAKVQIKGIKTISIDEITPIFNRNTPYPMATAFKDSSMTETPIMSGEQEVSASISVVYYIN